MTAPVERSRRAQFVACAIDSLVASGFSGTSLASVARRAGVAKSVVLYHFGTKQELLEAVVDTVYADAAPALLTAMERATTAAERFDAYVRGCVDFAWTHRGRVQALSEVFSNLRTPDGALRYTAADSAAMFEVVADLVRSGQATGEFGDVDPWTTAVVVRSTIDALPGEFTAGRDGPSVAEDLSRLFGRMLARSAPEHDEALAPTGAAGGSA